MAVSFPLPGFPFPPTFTVRGFFRE